MDDEALRKETCRVLVIGAHRARLEKVTSLLLQSEADPHLGEKSNLVRIEYIPCVAKFDSYQDEARNNINVRYLTSVEYYLYGPDGKLSSPGSLLPFFDEEEPDDCDDGPCPLFRGIAGAAIGSGIEGQEDAARIEAFLKTMASGSKNNASRIPKLKSIEPNPGYESMQHELAAYKALTTQEKEEATRKKTIGPGKMAKFVSSFAMELIKEALEERPSESLKAEQSPRPDVKVEAIAPPSIDHEPDPNKERFLCRKCRSVLFGEAELQDPPHETSQQTFSYRKHHHGACSASDNCQSYFLQDGMDWMGDDFRNGYPEGKFNCPACDSKLGNWNWSGAQCSCGTWVVPAIQIPKSKVDVVTPRPSALPPGAVLSPILQGLS